MLYHPGDNLFATTKNEEMTLSRLRILYERLFRKRTYIGSDLSGNHFFELYNPLHPGRPRRIVDYAQGTWRQVNEGMLPPQWLTWLKHTRRDPPSIQELEEDVRRRQILDYRLRQLQEAKNEELERKAIKAEQQGQQKQQEQEQEQEQGDTIDPKGPTQWTPRAKRHLS